MATLLGSASIATAAAGTTIGVLAGISAGHQADMAATVDAATIAQIGELNAQLIEEGGELNAGVHDFNAAALDNQAKDAITRGQEQEQQFRQQVKGLIGTQRAGFAGQGVDVSSGSAEMVQEDTARQGELDALQIRTNAAREAWGFTTQATGERLQSANTRQLATLQAKNTRDVSQSNAMNARLGGSIKQSASNWGAASTLLTGTTNVLQLAKANG